MACNTGRALGPTVRAAGRYICMTGGTNWFIGRQADGPGEVVKAVIVVKPDAAPLAAEALTAWCRNNMSAYKVPRAIEFRDSLPATGAGKVLRRLLK